MLRHDAGRLLTGDQLRPPFANTRVGIHVLGNHRQEIDEVACASVEPTVILGPERDAFTCVRVHSYYVHVTPEPERPRLPQSRMRSDS